MKKLLIDNIKEQFCINLDKNKNVISDSFSKYPGEKNKEIVAHGYGIFKDNIAKRESHRYFLEIQINNTGTKTLTAFMLNPSNSLPNEGFDQTVRNVIRIAYVKNYSKVVILNTFSLINGKGQDAISNYKKQARSNNDLNREIIDFYLKNYSSDLLIAWGTQIQSSDKNYYLKQIKNIQQKDNKNINLIAYAWNKNSNCPYHPSQQVDNNRENKDIDGESRVLSSFLKKNKKFKLLKINDNFELEFTSKYV